MPTKKNRWDGFIGLYGHTFLQGGDMDWQFQIVAQHGDLYGIQLYNWNTNEPMDDIRLVEKDVLIRANIYTTETELHEKRESWKRWDAAKRERERERYEDRARRERDEAIAEKRKALIDMFG